MVIAIVVVEGFYFRPDNFLKEAKNGPQLRPKLCWLLNRWRLDFTRIKTIAN